MSIQNPIEVKEQRERMFLRRQPSEDKSVSNISLLQLFINIK